jgi:hypothetical protein
MGTEVAWTPQALNLKKRNRNVHQLTLKSLVVMGMRTVGMVVLMVVIIMGMSRHRFSE